MATYYEILEVAQTATKKEIKKSYYRLSKQYHPDHNKGDKAAEEKFKAVGKAYSILSDDVKRKEYDEQLAAGPSQQPGTGAGGAGRGPAAQRPKPEAPGASASGIDIQHMQETFASFWGYDPKTKEVTDESKLNTYVEKDRKKNPLDMSGMFEKFMGFK